MGSSSKQISISVPEHWQCPFPSSFGPQENADAIDVGTHVAQHMRRTHQGFGDAANHARQEVFERVRELVHDQQNKLQEKLRVAEGEIESMRGRANSERVKLEVDIATERARLYPQIHADCLREFNEAKRMMEERALRAETELAAERAGQRRLVDVHECSARESAAHYRADVNRLTALVVEAKAREAALSKELADRNRQLARMSVPAHKGSAVECELLQALADAGLHPINTSKGAHTVEYHDILVAQHPLVATCAAGPPAYVADVPAVRCSVESKAHRSSGGIGAEREKFAEVRRRQMKARHAECFVFASTTPIPGQLRWHFEIAKIDGRHCVTGYAGASDLSATETVILVQATIKMQEKLDRETILPGKPNDATVASLVASATDLVHTLRAQIERCDKMEKAHTDLRDHTKALREALVASMFAQVDALVEGGFAPTDDTLIDVRDAHASLATSRLSNCKILRNKEQFGAAQRDSKRPRS